LGYVSEAKRKRTVTGTDTMELTCMTQCDKGDRIIFLDSTNTAREYIITDFEQERDTELKFSYSLVNSIQELAIFVIEERRNRGATASGCLEKALSGTRWAVGTVGVGRVNVADLAFYHTKGLAAVKATADAFSLEITTSITLSADKSRVVARYVNLPAMQGSTTPRRFDFGRNLKGLTRTIDTDDVITRLYPYGKGLAVTDENGDETGVYGRKISIADVNGGLPYIQDDSAVNVWGIPDANGHLQHAMAVKDYPEVEDPAILLALARIDLNLMKSPKASYKATVSVLGIEGQDRSAVGVGDSVQVVDTAYPSPIRISGRVLQINDDLLDPLSDDTTITLGNLTQSYTRSSEYVKSTVMDMWSSAGLWNDAAGLQPAYLDSVIDGLNTQMNQTGGYTYMTPNEGIIVYDKPVDQSPTMAIQLGGGYFRIANSKNSDGSWRWRTMGTGAGLVADILVAGVIRGGSNYWNLDTGELSFSRGRISDDDGKNYWDLSKGLFHVENGEFMGKLSQEYLGYKFEILFGELKGSFQGKEISSITLSALVPSTTPTTKRGMLLDSSSAITIDAPEVWIGTGESDHGVYKTFTGVTAFKNENNQTEYMSFKNGLRVG
jgi:phage minor structural protein